MEAIGIMLLRYEKNVLRKANDRLIVIFKANEFVVLYLFVYWKFCFELVMAKLEEKREKNKFYYTEKY